MNTFRYRDSNVWIILDPIPAICWQRERAKKHSFGYWLIYNEIHRGIPKRPLLMFQNTQTDYSLWLFVSFCWVFMPAWYDPQLSLVPYYIGCEKRPVAIFHRYRCFGGHRNSLPG